MNGSALVIDLIIRAKNAVAVGVNDAVRAVRSGLGSMRGPGMEAGEEFGVAMRLGVRMRLVGLGAEIAADTLKAIRGTQGMGEVIAEKIGNIWLVGPVIKGFASLFHELSSYDMEIEVHNELVAKQNELAEKEIALHNRLVAAWKQQESALRGEATVRRELARRGLAPSEAMESEAKAEYAKRQAEIRERIESLVGHESPEAVTAERRRLEASARETYEARIKEATALRAEENRVAEEAGRERRERAEREQYRLQQLLEETQKYNREAWDAAVEAQRQQAMKEQALDSERRAAQLRVQGEELAARIEQIREHYRQRIAEAKTATERELLIQLGGYAEEQALRDKMTASKARPFGPIASEAVGTYFRGFSQLYSAQQSQAGASDQRASDIAKNTGATSVGVKKLADKIDQLIAKAQGGRSIVIGSAA